MHLREARSRNIWRRTTVTCNDDAERRRVMRYAVGDQDRRA